MNASRICRICGQPAEAHGVALHGGVAHTVIRDATGVVVAYCSAVEADREYSLGQHNALTAVIRSLRNRAGRLRTRGEVWEPCDLYDYSDKLANDAERLARHSAELEKAGR